MAINSTTIVFTSAKYIRNFDTNVIDQVKAEIGGVMHWIPMDDNNIHYAEMLRQVADGDLTIADAD